MTGEGVAVVWSTAYLDEAERCDSFLLFNGGRLLPEIAISFEVLSKPICVSSINAFS